MDAAEVEENLFASSDAKIMGLVGELGRTVFALDQLEKEVGVSVITLLQKERKFNSNSNDCIELEIFHQAALKLGITSSRAALTERRALEKLIERAQAEEDKRKESIVAFLLHLMRKYSKLFRSDVTDDNDSQGLTPCSPTISCETNGGPLRGSCLNSAPSTSRKMGRSRGTCSHPQRSLDARFRYNSCKIRSLFRPSRLMSTFASRNGSKTAMTHHILFLSIQNLLDICIIKSFTFVCWKN